MSALLTNAFESLTLHDRKLVKQAVRDLRRVPARGAPVAVFDALRKCTPIAGGLIGNMRPRGVEAIVSHAVRLPKNVLEGWASAPRDQLAKMLGPLFSAYPGQLISDTEAIRGALRDDIELLHVLRESGLGEAAGYRVNREDAGGSRSLLFLTFALEADQFFSPRDHAMLAVLRPDIQSSLERLRLPLIPSQPILAQIVEERHLGFICMTGDRQCVELNQRARELATRYRVAARIPAGRAVVSTFAADAIAKKDAPAPWRLFHESGEGFLDVTTHVLSKETHVLGEDLWLVMLQETVISSMEDKLNAVNLTPRQREVAWLLVETGMPYKQMADHLGIEEGTVRTHVEAVYRRMGVSSRSELAKRLR